MASARYSLICLSLLSVLPLTAACGKKGPPLAPLRPTPAAVANLSATRVGDTVRLQFTVPTANADGSQPADVAYVDIYAVTGRPEGPLGRALTTHEIETLTTRVARLEVQPPPPPEGEDKPAPATPAPPDPRPAQGSVVSIQETLTDAIRAARFQHPDAEKIARLRASLQDEDVEEEDVPSTDGTGRTLLWPLPEKEVARTYIALAYSKHRRVSAASRPLEVSLVPAPAPPPAPAVTHDATSFTVTWAPPEGARAPIQPTVTVEAFKEAVAAGGTDDVRLPARPVVSYGRPNSYRVFQVSSPTAPAAEAVTPINTTPLETTTFVDPRIEFGVPRCYAVRTVEHRGAIAIESALSPITCLTPTDTYPPPAPTGLVAVGSEGGVSLIWEPVTAADLAGYLVLRGEEGEALKPITAEPIAETTYRDTTAQAGVMYTYAVVAVDRATPANASPESNRVREAAR